MERRAVVYKQLLVGNSVRDALSRDAARRPAEKQDPFSMEQEQNRSSTDRIQGLHLHLAGGIQKFYQEWGVRVTVLH